ncbi:rab proteins geranylgeranyltransferase component A 1 [Anoplophora glabripennis]|uniref:rab proteins geranylgeranyltransferase component A 1 n=1 Tax=Anoplophora glabripennis TaxID=217634 RepID=UPI0008742228|nr:rab proteins geranylgeranyltransferase component A 1 [Anoplophora glabripennis]
MDNQLPSDFDLIIVGTGMVESILSAAASRIGKRVLHIDRNDYYGGQWASFNLDAIQKIKEKQHYILEDANKLLQQDEYITSIGNDLFNIENVVFNWHIPEKASSEDVNNPSEFMEEKGQLELGDNTNPEAWTKESLLKETRKFNIDLTPKLQYARGDFVELLISSNIARYSEYRSVSRVLTWLNGQLEVVPCSRSDVFANSKVSVIEKRMLMKLLTSLDDGGAELKSYTNKTFRAFLKDRKLTPDLIHYVLYAISMSTDDTPCIEGVENTKRFLNSLGRFGKTPFLFSMYGSGEITQAFCRLSAVFGGIFALSQPISGYIFDDGGFKALLVGEQRIKADHIVMGIEKAPVKFVETVPKTYISRAVLITDRSILDSEKEHLTLLLYPPEGGKCSVTLIELGTLTGTCPKGLFLIHLISRQNTNPEEDFKHVVDSLFITNGANETEPSCKPRVLWSFYFSIADTNGVDLKQNVPKNTYICPGPDIDMDFDLAIKEAKKIFAELYPETEFLPRAPDPEEIIIGGEEEATEESTDTGDKEKGGGDTVVEELVRNIQNQDIEDTLDRDAA